MFERIYLVAFLILFFIVVFLVSSVRVKRKTGINPFVFKRSDSAHDYLGKVSGPITSIVLINALFYLIFPTVIEYFAPFTWLEVKPLKFAGFVLIHVSFLWIVVAQLQMSNSWRIGIDHASKTELKTGGLFSVSRNPVFLGIIITLCGVFFILPNALTMLTVVTSALLFQVQVRLEEEYLLKVHGSAYESYCNQTGRWLWRQRNKN